MQFLIDTQLPSALARYLIAQGHQAEHVLELEMAQAKDKVIWNYAKANRAIIVSKDEDFIAMHLRFGEGPQVVWVRCGNLRRAALLALFASALPSVLTALAVGEPIVEIA